VSKTLAFIASRVGRGIGTLIALTALTYFMIEWTIDGGVGAVVLGGCPRDATEGACARIIEQYRLDDPVPIRYLRWLGDAFTGDLNVTARNGGSVLDAIRHRAPITTELALAAIVLAVVVSVPLGVFAAYKDTSWKGKSVSYFVQVMQSVPVFVTGLFLIWVFSERLGVLPASGWTRISDSLTGNLKGLILPAVTLAFAEIGVFARVIRADILDTFGEEFVSAARSKGLSARYLLFRHVLRPSSAGLLTVIGLNLSTLLGGALIVEIVFGIGGTGPLLFEAILARDIYMIQGMTLYIGAIYVTVSGIVDYIYSVVDPRIIDAATAKGRYA
jgi:peptide/nickel transport system permease protein